MKNTINRTVILLLPILGLLIPTSANGIISERYKLLLPFTAIALLLILFLNNPIYQRNIKYSILIHISLIFPTFIQMYLNNSYFSRIIWGSYLPFIALSLIYCISYKKIGNEKLVYQLFIATNLFILLMGFFIIKDSHIIDSFFLKNYSIGYPELVNNMLTFNKPITFFGSHSIAAFFYYLFFFINLITYKYKGKILYLILSVLNIAEMFFLNSVSSIIILCISLIQLIYFFYKYKYKKYFKIVSMLVALIALSFAYATFKDDIFIILSRQNNGFLSRFAAGGVLSSNINYITSHILPIGLWYSDELYFTDSGIILNHLKGSVFLILAVYRGLYLFLKYNIYDKKIVKVLTFMFIIFEIAYPILNFARMLFLLPFLTVYLNNLTKMYNNKD